MKNVLLNLFLCPSASATSTTVTTSPATATGAATTVPSSPYANEMAVQDLPTMTQVWLLEY